MVFIEAVIFVGLRNNNCSSARAIRLKPHRFALKPDERTRVYPANRASFDEVLHCGARIRVFRIEIYCDNEVAIFIFFDSHPANTRFPQQLSGVPPLYFVHFAF